MDIYVLDSGFNIIDVIDTYESFIWTERFIECGDFELYINYEKDFLSSILKGVYLQIKTSKTLMVIEDISTEKPSPDDAVKLVITGRCLKSLLYRRIIWGQKIFEGEEYFEIEEVIESLINDAIINPKKTVTIRSSTPDDYDYSIVEAPERKIENFHFVKKQQSDNDYTTVHSAKINGTQFNGENLGEAVVILCASKNIGIEVTFNDGHFYCMLLGGVDRSYNQTTKSFVVFSPQFDNLANTNFKIETKEYKNVTIIQGQGDDEEFRLVAVEGDGSSGINRRELYTDCSSVELTKTDWNSEISEYESIQIANDEYMKIIREKGIENLKQYEVKRQLDGEIINHVMYEYGVDYFLGDIVQTEDEYGNTGRSRVLEYVQCQDSNGYQSYPTFSSIDEEEENDTE